MTYYNTPEIKIRPQTHLKSNGRRPVKGNNVASPQPRSNKGILLVGSGTGYALTLNQRLREFGQEPVFTGVVTEPEAVDLLRKGYKANAFYDMIILSKGLKDPYQIGFLTSELQNRSACGSVFVMSPIDELRARKLGMIPVGSISELVDCYLRPRKENNYNNITVTEKQLSKPVHETPCLDEKLAALRLTRNP